MNRRHLLIAIAVLGLMPVGLALAHNGDDVIPGFEAAMKAGKPVLVHVTAPWCEVCQIQKPIVKDLLGRPDFQAMQKFDVDFDSQKEILAKFRVNSQSTMIVFKGGKELDRQVGQTDPATIETLLREAL
jgi:thiol-disulfide isomerase/thioredoxin